MWSNWSVLTIMLCISKELWSSLRAWFCSILMTSWSHPHMAWHCFHCPDAWYFLEASSTVPSSGSVVALVGLEGGLVGSCTCGSELGLTSYANACVSSSPCVELCSLLDSTSWESTWVLLSWWLPSQLLGDGPTFSVWGQQWTQQMGALLGECQQRGYPVKEVLEEVESQFNELDCLWGLKPVSPLAQVQWWSLECPLPVAWWWPAHCSCSEEELWRRSTRATAWMSQWSSPENRPHERSHPHLWPFVLTVSHASWPTWSADYCIFKPTPVSPELIHIPAGLWPGCYFASIWGLGESLILPSSGCSFLDGEADKGTDSEIRLERQCSSSKLCHNTFWK